MVNLCTVKGCKNNSEINRRLGFFKIPKDDLRQLQWLEKIDRLDLLSMGTQSVPNKRVCGEHFESKMFAGLGYSRLKKHAIPTIFKIKQGEGLSPFALQTSNTENVQIETSPSLSTKTPIKEELQRTVNILKRKYKKKKMLKAPVPVIENITVKTSGLSMTNVLSPVSRKGLPSLPPETSITENVQIETSPSLSTKTPIKEQLQRTVNVLKRTYKKKKKISKAPVSAIENITAETSGLPMTNVLSPVSREGLPSLPPETSITENVQIETSPSLPTKTPINQELPRTVIIIKRKKKKKVSKVPVPVVENITAETFYHFVNRNFKESLAKFIIMQYKLSDKKRRGARYTEEFKQFALTLYYLSPKIYRHLQDTFYLPSETTLSRMTCTLPLTTS